MSQPAFAVATALAIAATAWSGDPPPAAPPPSLLVAFPDGLAVVLDADSGEPRFSVKTAAKEWRVARREEAEAREVLCRSLPISMMEDRVLAVEGTELATYDRNGKRRVHSGSVGLEGAAFLHARRRGEDVLAAVPCGNLLRFWKSSQWEWDDGDFLRMTGPPEPEYRETKSEGFQEGPFASVHHAGTGLWFLADGSEGLASMRPDALEIRDAATRRLGYPPVLALAVSHAGTRLAVSHGSSLRVKVIVIGKDGKFGEQVGAFKADSPARSLAWSADGSLLALGSDSGEIRVARSEVVPGASSGMVDLVGVAAPGKSPIRLLHFLKDPALLLAVDDDGVARTIRWKTAEVGATRKLR